MVTSLPPHPVQKAKKATKSLGLVLWVKLFVLGILAYIAASPFFFHFFGAAIARAGKPSPLPLAAVVAITGVQVALVVAFSAWAFVALGPQLGLDSPVLRGVKRLREVLLQSMLIGSVAALAIVAIQRGFRPFLPVELLKADTDATMGGSLLGISASFYGGIIEEAMLRLGVMTVLAYALYKVRVPKAAALITANVGAAILFGVGHLPAARALGIPFTPSLVAYIILGNAMGGIFFGWLYAKRGVEAAMAGHFTADLWLHVVLPSVLA